MDAPIFVINSGSSSLKFGLFERADSGGEAAKATGDVRVVARGSADGIGSDRGKVSLRSADGELLYEQGHAIDDQPQALGLVAELLKSHGLPSPEAIGHRVVHG